MAVATTWTCACTWMLVAAQAMAGEVGEVISGAGATSTGRLVDARLAIAFAHDSRTSTLRREVSGTGEPTALVRDLRSEQQRNVLALRGDLGLLGGVSLFAEAPIVLSDDRLLRHDGDGAAATAAILRDGILPGYGGTTYGWDATRSRPFSAPDDRVFRGPTRNGLPYLGIGLAWAIFNQKTDASQTTWIVRGAARLSIDDEMGYDPAAPKANTAVGLGYHELVVSTVWSRRLQRLEPFVNAFCSFAIPTEGGAYERADLGTGFYSRPQQRAGAAAGVEATLWENPAARQRVSIGARAGIELRLPGLTRSELWEPLSGASTCPADRNACRPAIDRDLDGDGAPDPNLGITRSPAYGLLVTDVALDVDMSRYLRGRAGFGYVIEQDRHLTDGRTTDAAYGSVGRRYRVEGAHGWRASVEFSVLFR